MEQFESPAAVPAAPNANTTDLLVERVKATPNSPLFAPNPVNCSDDADYSSE